MYAVRKCVVKKKKKEKKESVVFSTTVNQISPFVFLRYIIKLFVSV